MILETLIRMHRELYGKYAEFEEAYMTMKNQLRPLWKEYQKEGRNQMPVLFEQSYTRLYA
jgi:hypothetical protein